MSEHGERDPAKGRHEREVAAHAAAVSALAEASARVEALAAEEVRAALRAAKAGDAVRAALRQSAPTDEHRPSNERERVVASVIASMASGDKRWTPDVRDAAIVAAHRTIDALRQPAPQQRAGFDTRTPGAEAVNALPDPVRRYIHDLETRCDPAGDVRALSVARDSIAALTIELAEARDFYGRLTRADVRRLRRERDQARGDVEVIARISQAEFGRLRDERDEARAEVHRIARIAHAADGQDAADAVDDRMADLERVRAEVGRLRRTADAESLEAHRLTTTIDAVLHELEQGEAPDRERDVSWCIRELRAALADPPPDPLTYLQQRSRKSFTDD